MIELKELDGNALSSILEKYLIEHKIDKDGDIALDSDAGLYIRVDEENERIRFFAFIHNSSLAAVEDEDFNVYLDFINAFSYFVKFSKLRPIKERSPLLCESCLVTSGTADDVFIIKTIRRIEREISDAKKAVIDFKTTVEEIIKNDRETA